MLQQASLEFRKQTTKRRTAEQQQSGKTDVLPEMMSGENSSQLQKREKTKEK